MEKKDISDLIKDKIAKEKPTDLENLLDSLIIETKMEKEELLSEIIEMSNSGQINLIAPEKQPPRNLIPYLFSRENLWFWEILITSIATLNAVILIPLNSSFTPLRYILGSVFLLFLPGYSFMHALFPLQQTNMETILLSLGMSLAMLPLIAILLNLTSLGLGVTPVILSLLLSIVTFSLIGIVRGYYKRRVS